MSSIEQFTVQFDSKDRRQAVANALREYGVAVITNVFPEEQCNIFMNNIIEGMTTISPKLATNSFAAVKKTWNESNLLPQVRPGMHKIGYSFLGWPVRASPQVCQVFQEVYSELRSHEISELVTSVDAINIRPPIPPFVDTNKDWAHIDQTFSDETFQCIQGQVVLTNTTAAFRCSPKSHLLHSKILQKYGVLGMQNNFYKFTPEDYPELQQMVEQEGGAWQIPIVVPKGSMILWTSSTIHSARLAFPISLREFDVNDKYNHWRGVVYVCHRPKEEVDESHLRILQRAVEENLSTNHWGNSLETRVPHANNPKFPPSPTVLNYAKNPAEILKIPGLFTKLSPHERKLIGMDDA